jgi:hypothetical protein
MHVRAKVEDLRVTLKKIGRNDILDMLNRRLSEEAANLKRELDPNRIKNLKKEVEIKRKFNALNSKNVNFNSHGQNQLQQQNRNHEIEKKIMNPVSEAVLKNREAELLHMNLTRFLEKQKRAKQKALDEAMAAAGFKQHKQEESVEEKLLF